MTLTDAVLKAAIYIGARRVRKLNTPFAVFAIADEVQLCGTDTKAFEKNNVRADVKLVGVYFPTVRVADLIADMAEFFSDKPERK
jgi:hypothetical protein